MHDGNQRILALGNTASVLPSIATCMRNLYVACPTNISVPVLLENEKCFRARELDYPVSVSCRKFLGRMSREYELFHAELKYAAACDSLGLRYGVHIHGTTDVQLLFPKTRLGWLLKRPYGDALRNASYVVCHPAVVDSIRALRKDVSSLELPVDPDVFNMDVDPFDYGDAVPIFSPSRIDKWKGHEIIWEAIRLMRNRGKAIVYQSDWGWEPDFSHLKSRAPANVRFMKIVPRSKIARYYKGAKLVIGQMKIGHFGMTELEAAACGVPVVVYLRDEKSPFLPKKNDPRSLAEAMDLLIEDSKFSTEYAKACSEYVLKNFSLAKVTGRLERILATSSPERHHRSTMKSLPNLVAGTGFELADRILRGRVFALLKFSLIGL